MRKNLINFCENIKINFNNIDILKQSLIHKSYDAKFNNEKLEFLGDRVLGLILSKTLLKKFPKEKEGSIDKKFANLVNKKVCAEIGNSLNIKKYMLLGSSYQGASRSDEKIISDSLEALIGAIFLDQGIDSAEKFILNYWRDYIDKSDKTLIDSKTQLQEYTLKKFKVLPKYKMNKQVGPQHDPVFKVEVQIPNSRRYSATGNSKKKAQQNAAKKLLNDLKV